MHFRPMMPLELKQAFMSSGKLHGKLHIIGQYHTIEISCKRLEARR
jgi:hypothetical protein